MRNELWSIYNDKYFEIWTFLHVKSIKIAHILWVRCGFWRFLPFQACFAITVIPVQTKKEKGTTNAWFEINYKKSDTRLWKTQ